MQPSEEDALELLASHALLKIPANKDMPALLLTPLRSNCCPSSAIRKHSSGILSASPSHSRQQPLDPDTDTAFTLLIEQVSEQNPVIMALHWYFRRVKNCWKHSFKKKVRKGNNHGEPKGSARGSSWGDWYKR